MIEKRKVVGTDGRYFVSEDGEVFVASTGLKLKPQENSNGYLRVGISYPDGRRKRRIHHLVAEAFLGYEGYNESGLVVDHINHKRDDNRVENLRVVSPEENQMFRVDREFVRAMFHLFMDNHYESEEEAIEQVTRKLRETR